MDPIDPHPPTNNSPSKSNLKRKPVPAFSQNDETVNDEIKFHFTSSSAEDDSDGASDLPPQFIHFIDDSPCADYRRLFSISSEKRKRFSHRKAELGQFFPPEYPKADDAKKRYEKSEKFLHEKAQEAWKDSVSSEKMYKYDAMRKRINVDAIREKFNQKKPLPKKEKNSDASTSRGRPRTNNRAKHSNSAAIAEEESGDDAPNDNREGNDEVYDRYLANLPSTSLPRTTPAYVKNNLYKSTTRVREETIPEESSAEKFERSYLDEHGERNTSFVRRQRKRRS